MVSQGNVEGCDGSTPTPLCLDVAARVLHGCVRTPGRSRPSRCFYCADCADQCADTAVAPPSYMSSSAGDLPRGRWDLAVWRGGTKGCCVYLVPASLCDELGLCGFLLSATGAYGIMQLLGVPREPMVEGCLGYLCASRVHAEALGRALSHLRLATRPGGSLQQPQTFLRLHMMNTLRSCAFHCFGAMANT